MLFYILTSVFLLFGLLIFFLIMLHFSCSDIIFDPQSIKNFDLIDKMVSDVIPAPSANPVVIATLIHDYS